MEERATTFMGVLLGVTASKDVCRVVLLGIAKTEAMTIGSIKSTTAHGRRKKKEPVI
jgi:hypothetical protein